MKQGEERRVGGAHWLSLSSLDSVSGWHRRLYVGNYLDLEIGPDALEEGGVGVAAETADGAAGQELDLLPRLAHSLHLHSHRLPHRALQTARDLGGEETSPFSDVSRLLENRGGRGWEESLGASASKGSEGGIHKTGTRGELLGVPSAQGVELGGGGLDF